MKSLLLTCCFFLLGGPLLAEPHFVILVRHAEKASSTDKDSHLSSTGLERAKLLAQMLPGSGVTAIFVTEFKRTQETAAPAARALAITPTIVAGKDTPGLIGKLHELNGNALVVGHGNSIPEVLKALGIETPITIGENDYDDLFVVAVEPKPQLLRLRYPKDRP